MVLKPEPRNLNLTVTWTSQDRDVTVPQAGVLPIRLKINGGYNWLITNKLQAMCIGWHGLCNGRRQRAVHGEK
jgi:hypothetical protein